MTVEMAEVSATCRRVLDEVSRAVVGKRAELEKIMAAVLAGGHVLLEDYPGLGKTLIARSFAATLGLDFKRIQFTPDLLPADITGGYVYNRVGNCFDLRPGPLFTHLLLADEINRASPKTQSALLEAMQEYQVTLEGETLKLPQPFCVMATQNPIEYEGTFPLPEAQLDRFLIKVAIGYPSLAEEQEIVQRRRERGQDEVALQTVSAPEALLAMRQAVEKVYVAPDLERYLVTLVAQTRKDQRVAVGASPRASLALLKLARAKAALEGRDFIVPDDVKAFVQPVLIHRIILQPEHWMKQRVVEEVIDGVLRSVPVPVLETDGKRTNG
jgi:MoxR-like ATPase